MTNDNFRRFVLVLQRGHVVNLVSTCGFKTNPYRGGRAPSRLCRVRVRRMFNPSPAPFPFRVPAPRAFLCRHPPRHRLRNHSLRHRDHASARENRNSMTGSVLSMARSLARILADAVSAAWRSPSVPGRENRASIFLSLAMSCCSSSRISGVLCGAARRLANAMRFSRGPSCASGPPAASACWAANRDRVGRSCPQRLRARTGYRLGRS